MTEPVAGDRVWAKGWGEDVTVIGVLQPAIMDEPRTVRDDCGNDLYVTGPIHRYDVAERAEQTNPDPKRINVAINPETLAALKAVIDRDGVSLTEAVRRLLGYGEVVWRAVKEDQAAVLLQWADETKEVVIL